MSLQFKTRLLNKGTKLYLLYKPAKAYDNIMLKPTQVLYCRCQILSLQYYDEDALSILLHYTPKKNEEEEEELSGSGSAPLPHQAVAQLPVEGVVSLLPWDMVVESHDPTESVDVGRILTQVCPLGPLRAGKLAVSGSRKLAAVVRN